MLVRGSYLYHMFRDTQHVCACVYELQEKYLLN